MGNVERRNKEISNLYFLSLFHIINIGFMDFLLNILVVKDSS